MYPSLHAALRATLPIQQTVPHVMSSGICCCLLPEDAWTDYLVRKQHGTLDIVSSGFGKYPRGMYHDSPLYVNRRRECSMDHGPCFRDALQQLMNLVTMYLQLTRKWGGGDASMPCRGTLYIHLHCNLSILRYGGESGNSREDARREYLYIEDTMQRYRYIRADEAAGNP